MYRLYITVLSLFILTCATVDFIPDPDYSPHYLNYSKTSWKEVEVYFDRPNKRISIQGEIKIRDFNNSGRVGNYIDNIKREMFRKKMDGVWIQNSSVQPIQDSVFQTRDSRGNVTHTHGGTESNIMVWTGYAYRNR